MSNNNNAEIMVAGAVAAFTVDMLVYPLDTIKTRYQSQDFIKTYTSASSASSSSSAASGTAAAAEAAAKAATRAARTPTSAAFRGLYQGVGSVIIATLPAAGIFFTTYESAKSGLGSALPAAVPQPLVHAGASATAELASCLILTPGEVIKQNAQMIRRSGSTGPGGSRGSTSMQALRMVWHSERGAGRRLWTGYTALAARNLPFTALQFPMFEFARVRAWAYRDQKRLERGNGASSGTQTKQGGGVTLGQGLLETGLVNGLSAGASGAVSAVLTTPTDVVKTRMMLSARDRDPTRGEGGGPGGVQGHKRHRGQSGFEVARLVWRERGIRGLFRGATLRGVWTAVGSGLYLGTYEAAKVWLKGETDGRNEDGI